MSRCRPRARCGPARGRRRGDGHAVLVVLDLAGDADLHGDAASLMMAAARLELDGGPDRYPRLPSGGPAGIPYAPGAPGSPDAGSVTAGWDLDALGSPAIRSAEPPPPPRGPSGQGASTARRLRPAEAARAAAAEHAEGPARGCAARPTGRRRARGHPGGSSRSRHVALLAVPARGADPSGRSSRVPGEVDSAALRRRSRGGGQEVNQHRPSRRRGGSPRTARAGAAWQQVLAARRRAAPAGSSHKVAAAGWRYWCTTQRPVVAVEGEHGDG